MQISPKIAVIQNKDIQKKNLTVFPDVVKLFASETVFDIVVINLSIAMADMTVKALRRHKDYRYTLIYSTSKQSDYFESLSDGIIPPTVGEITETLNKVTERLRIFNNGNPPESFDHRVMAWLWMRGEANIVPVRNPNKKSVYEYPLLECLTDGEKVNFFSWLNLIKERGILDPSTLVDRLRLCGGCGSSRLNYIDVCPECNDLDICRSPAIHCFTCGHIGAQELFLKGGVMACPKCKERLRHIGSDYDRPMENYSCKNCHSFFVDAKVTVQCNDCSHSHSAEELKVQPIRGYGLSEKGRLFCRNGFDYEQKIAEHFTRGCFVSQEMFNEFLNWHIQMSHRYRDFTFSLIGIRLLHLSSIIEKAGQLNGHTLIDSLVDRINAMFRTTDKGARCQEDCLWIILPATDAKGLEALNKRIAELPKMFSSDLLDMLEMRVIGHTISHNQGADIREDAELMIARFYADMED